MIGTKLYKNNADDMAQYTATAQWCNANNAHIEDKGNYYEVFENIIPPKTKQQLLSDLDSQYDQDRAELVHYYNEAVFLNDVELQEELREEMTELNNTYIQERKNIEEGDSHE